MLGPVPNSSAPPASVLTLVFGEVICLAIVFIGIFGEMRPRGAFSKPLRILTKVVFVVAGTWLLWTAVKELRARENGDAIALLTFVVTATCLAVVDVASRWKYKGWRSWPISEATIEDVQVREIRTRHNHYFVAELAYSYVVNGDYFSGRFTRDFAREQEGWDYANRLRGAKVVVRHHPEHFERSKLDATPGSAM